MHVDQNTIIKTQFYFDQNAKFFMGEKKKNKLMIIDFVFLYILIGEKKRRTWLFVLLFTSSCEISTSQTASAFTLWIQVSL